ncbi:hypothetical protein CRENBAI_014501 [Crenichthys baileyi]|uniref:Uncharacterized protein n=1 Tax=Crenichthys baileyi TaxID=28760 RepID=A0AAV9R221_9TELE
MASAWWKRLFSLTIVRGHRTLLAVRRLGAPLETSSSDQSLWSVDSAAVQRYIYTSATQRSYEEVNWSLKFPGCLNAADVSLERLADPVSDRASARRYNGRPQLWQVSHGEETNAAKAGGLLFASVLMLTAFS